MEEIMLQELIDMATSFEYVVNSISIEILPVQVYNEETDKVDYGAFSKVRFLVADYIDDYIVVVNDYKRLVLSESDKLTRLYSVISERMEELEDLLSDLEFDESKKHGNSENSVKFIKSYKKFLKNVISNKLYKQDEVLVFLAKTKQILSKNCFKIQYLNSKFEVLKLSGCEDKVYNQMNGLETFQKYIEDSVCNKLSENDYKFMLDTKDLIEKYGEAINEYLYSVRVAIQDIKYIAELCKEIEELSKVFKIEVSPEIMDNGYENLTEEDIKVISEEIIYNYNIASKTIPESSHTFLIEMGFEKDLSENIEKSKKPIFPKELEF